MDILSAYSPNQSLFVFSVIVSPANGRILINIAAWASAGTKKINSRWFGAKLWCPHCITNGDDVVLQQAINTDLGSTSNSTCSLHVLDNIVFSI